MIKRLSTLLILIVALCSIGAYTTNFNLNLRKIDSLAVDGLTGVYNSLSYKVHEIERHDHSSSRWFEEAVTPAGETHLADRIGEGSGASFMVDAGNDTWGTWTQILGSSDTPADVGMVYFDLHQILITDSEAATVYHMQIASGATGAAAYSAGTYTEFSVVTVSPFGKSVSQEVQSGRYAAGTKVWIRTKAEGADTATVHFRIGMHEYEG